MNTSWHQDNNIHLSLHAYRLGEYGVTYKARGGWGFIQIIFGHLFTLITGEWKRGYKPPIKQFHIFQIFMASFIIFCLHLLPNFAPSIIQVCILGGKNILCIHCTEREDWPEWVKWIKYELDECWIIHILSLNINSDMRVLITVLIFIIWYL